MITIKTSNSITAKSTNLCFIVDQVKTLNQFELLKPFEAHIKKKLSDKKSQILRLFHQDKHMIVVVIQKDAKISSSAYLESLRKLGNEVGHKLNSEKAKEVCFSAIEKSISSDEYLAFLEGMVLGNYQFLKYKSDKQINSLTSIVLSGFAPKSTDINELLNVLESNLIARDLINEPIIHLNTIQLSKEITKLGKKTGFSVKILSKAEIQKLKMGGLLGVNLGSVDPPIFAILEWKPANAKNKKPYVLVGKGVVYDTGGYSLKTGPHMATMKSDMSGAAAVIGTMNAVSKNKLPLHVVGLIPATDNRVHGNALVPDDIITMMDGTTVEVLNTDAEGRLILGDALAYAKKYKPELVIDLATLTGAASAITGPFGTAMMGTADNKVKSKLSESGEHTYERVAEMPFWDEYSDLLKSPVADLKNIGGPTGGAMTAGKFLQHFTDYPWIHLDIAGPAFLDKQDAYKSQGGTGVGVRLLYHFLKSKTSK